jgi:hypothetical protein
MWTKTELVRFFIEHERKLLQLLLDYGTEPTRHRLRRNQSPGNYDRASALAWT